MDYLEQRLPPNPINKANPISRILFLWIIPLFVKGYKKELEPGDLYDVHREDDTEYLGNQLERYWELEIEKSKLTRQKPSLSRAIVRTSIKPFMLISIIYVINQCIIITAQPVFLRLLIVTFNEENVSDWKPYTYAGVISFIAFVNTISLHPAVFLIMRMGMKIRIATSTLIYRKCLRLSKSAQNQTNSGQIVNLLSNDCTRFDISLNFLPFIVTAPIQVSILVYLLYDQIGPACLTGVAFIILFLPMQYYIGKYSAVFRRLIAGQTDERGRFMNEIIIGMRVIKQYAWEKPFSYLIAKIRKAEVVELKKRGYLRGLHMAMISFAPKLVQYMTFLAFVLLEDEPMTSDKVFFTLSCLHLVIQITIHFTPQAATGIGEMIVAIHRIQEFLLLDEQKSNNTLKFNDRPLMPNGVRKVKQDGDGNNNSSADGSGVRLTMENVCASWGERPTLDNISFSFDVRKGEGDGSLVMVVGPVGSSKTSLLHAIIDELPISSGYLSINGTVSYASQEPWIFAGNLRQNILFGLPYDASRYNEIVRVCALVDDFKQLPHADMTIVGERGVALSGGQKARVNLSRALYRESDIYLLDDPLSAVDTRVSRHLFEKCIKEHLRGSIRILVTHQLQYLPQADYVIVLNQGKAIAQGTYQQLINAGIDFVGLIDTNESEEAASRRQSTVEEKLEEKGQKTQNKAVEKGKPAANAEAKSGGSVTGRTYWDYFLAGHSVPVFFILITTFIFCQVVTSGNDYWLSYWTNAEAKRMSLENCTEPATRAGEKCDDGYLGESTYLYVYTGFVVAVTLANIIRSVWFYEYTAKISISIHDKMFRSLIRAPIKFFDDNPSGRIMNRFTKDVGTMDELLPPAFIDTIIIFLQVFGVIVVVVLSNYYMGVPTVFLLIALYFIRKFFIETARDLKRIESVTRSPVFTHVAATIQGLTTIRACKSQNVLIKQFEGHQNIHTSSWFLFLGANRCFGIWLELICDVFLLVVSFSFLLISTSDQGGNVGLAISSILTMSGSFQWGMRQSAETENYMTSVERALEYSKLKPEAELETGKPGSEPPSLHWPDMGQVEFKEVSLKYEDDKPPVLNSLTFKIRPREKIGIVGRTGAGKSSIIAALFRLTEPDGEIWIDNIRVNDIGLHELRKKISIIPQDPVLFSGTVRYNLDPFNQFEDSDLWRVIEEVELKEAVPSLDYNVADGGANFSVGQRQLVCLGRAILRKNRVLVMDEATANVDLRTDGLIQTTIKNKFSECTIITIAHRINTIIDYDRILVLDHGNLREYDHPYTLLQNEHGIFTGMVAQTGHSSSSILKRMAYEAFKKQSPSTHFT